MAMLSMKSSTNRRRRALVSTVVSRVDVPFKCSIAGALSESRPVFFQESYRRCKCRSLSAGVIHAAGIGQSNSMIDDEYRKSGWFCRTKSVLER